MSWPKRISEVCVFEVRAVKACLSEVRPDVPFMPKPTRVEFGGGNKDPR